MRLCKICYWLLGHLLICHCSLTETSSSRNAVARGDSGRFNPPQPDRKCPSWQNKTAGFARSCLQHRTARASISCVFRGSTEATRSIRSPRPLSTLSLCLRLAAERPWSPLIGWAASRTQCPCALHVNSRVVVFAPFRLPSLAVAIVSRSIRDVTVVAALYSLPSLLFVVFFIDFLLLIRTKTYTIETDKQAIFV